MHLKNVAGEGKNKQGFDAKLTREDTQNGYDLSQEWQALPILPRKGDVVLSLAVRLSPFSGGSGGRSSKR